jgi:hypothetical protein
MEGWIDGQIGFPIELGSVIRGLQKQNRTTSVPGLMLWLHTARAFLTPELRFTSRQLWNEVAKASNEANAIAIELCAATGHIPLAFDCRRVPSGMEPLDR